VYGAEVSKQTISTITDRVLEGMTEWQNRPLDVVCEELSSHQSRFSPQMRECSLGAEAHGHADVRAHWKPVEQGNRQRRFAVGDDVLRRRLVASLRPQ
jgi:hypothetical protein